MKSFSEKNIKSELPTKITSSADNFPLPDAFWDSIYEYLQDKYGRDADKYAQSFGVEVIVSDIEWADLPERSVK